MKTLLFTIALVLTTTSAWADTYDAKRDSIAKQRAETSDAAAKRAQLLEGFDALARHWLGTTWGLGLPQTDTPRQGKINCGTFVGTILAHLAFELNVKKLQRQPAELIIKTFTLPKEMLRFRNRPVDEFVAKVRAQGDGLYIIGLDFHVGFLRVKDGDVRFVHASYETLTVVDEAAVEAGPIVTSKYRVVGKLLDDRMLDAWSNSRDIRVVGNW